MKKEIVEEIEKDIKEKNTMTKEYEGKVNKRILSNILIAILMSAYLMVLLLGNKNIERNIFLLDLKVLSVVIALISIIIFEKSYRKSDGRLCLYGVEVLILAFISLTSVYILQMAEDIFMTVICSLVVTIAVYYIIKSILIYGRSKKKFVESQNDINDIIKEELPETVETKRRRNTLEAEMAEYAKLNAEESSKKVTRTIKTNIRKEESLFDDEDEDDINIDDIEFRNSTNNKITNSNIEDFEEDNDELGINNFKIEDTKESDLEEIKLVEKIIETEKKTTNKKKSTKVKSNLDNKSESKKNISKEPKEKQAKKTEQKKEKTFEKNTEKPKKETTKMTNAKENIVKETKTTIAKKENVDKSRAKRKLDKTE